MKKAVIIAVLVLLLLVLVVGAFFWYSIGQPLYQPGMVRASQDLGAPLVPPEQTIDEHLWTMEEDIQLFHFSTDISTFPLPGCEKAVPTTRRISTTGINIFINKSLWVAYLFHPA